MCTGNWESASPRLCAAISISFLVTSNWILSRKPPLLTINKKLLTVHCTVCNNGAIGSIALNNRRRFFVRIETQVALSLWHVEKRSPNANFKRFNQRNTLVLLSFQFLIQVALWIAYSMKRSGRSVNDVHQPRLFRGSSYAFREATGW